MKKLTHTQKSEEREKRILELTNRIQATEKRIDKEEKKILAQESKILTYLRSGTSTSTLLSSIVSRGFYFTRLVFLRKLSKHKLLSTLLVTLAAVLIWRGIWHTIDEVPFISYSIVSLALGILLIWLLQKYSDLH